MTEQQSDRVLLQHIIEAIDMVLSYTDGMDMDAFLNSRLVQDACIRNFLVMGEAVKRLSEEVRSQHPDIPWKKIAGMRDKLVHDYLGIDKVALWLTIERVLPRSRDELSHVLNTLPE
ncbi:MAG: DUF86 domain-containing protein [Flavobacteriales bacterium]|jgi:uncharacterized protein with HEPN domain|nr:DUF86 domain-containing protein [Flavobacteriales bacterium]